MRLVPFDSYRSRSPLGIVDSGFQPEQFRDDFDNTLRVPIGGGGGGGGIRPTPTLTIPSPVITPPREIEPIEVLPPPPPPPPIPVVRGCKDRDAENYNRFATLADNNLCKYRQQEIITETQTIKHRAAISISSKKKPTVLIINGKRDFRSAVGPIPFLNYSDKELSNPKIIQGQFGRLRSREKYRIKSVTKSYSKDIKPILRPDLTRRGISIGRRPGQTTRTFAVGKIVYDYKEIILERSIDNGPYLPVPVPQKDPRITGITDKTIPITLSFSYEEIILPPPPIEGCTDVEAENYNPNATKDNGTCRYPQPQAEERVIKVTIDGLQVPGENIIKYSTSWGREGFVTNDIIDLSHVIDDDLKSHYIEFIPSGIGDSTHKGKYSILRNGKIEERYNLQTKVNLSEGVFGVKIDIDKNVFEGTDVSKPSLNVSRTSAQINIASNERVSINYNSSNADRVIYSLGKTKRTLSTSGTITLTKNDFYNGVGNYVLYLQPISNRDGSGDVQKINVNVLSKEYLPGPDITHINYPQNVKGADFKGFNVDFKISWQSVNTNYVRIYAGKYNERYNVGQFAGSGVATFNIASILRKSHSLQSNRDISRFKLLLVPFNSEGDSTVSGKVEEISITFDKGDLTLNRGSVISDIQRAFSSLFNRRGFDIYTSKLLNHYLHLGDGDNKLIATWTEDRETFSEYRVNEADNTQIKLNNPSSLVLKLYEPLPRGINTNDSIWVSKVQSIPLIDEILIEEDFTRECVRLTPNFSLDITDDIGYQVLDDLVASGSSTSTNLLNQYVSSSGIPLNDLDIQFVTSSEKYYWKNFIKYSSAEERIENFYYKVKLIQSYDEKYEELTSGSAGSSWTGSLNVVNEAQSNLYKSQQVKNGFDAFEKFLFESSSESGLSYPKVDNTGSFIHPTSASAVSWYDSAIVSARDYDYDNKNILRYNIPAHVYNDSKNEEFVLFLDMIGQHFDILWNYIKGISYSKKLEHKYDSGITDKLIYHMLESLGWDADLGIQSQFLWEYAFGQDKDGTQVQTMSGKDRQQEVWRRLLNNLPYMFKHKGTKRAVHAALSCYGIPQSLLTVMEFGGPNDPTQSGTTKFTFEDRTASINVSGSQSIIVPWKEYSETSDYPNCIEIRLNTETRQDQQILSGSDWSVHLMKDSGTMGHFELRMMSGSTLLSASTDSGSFFNDEYTQFVLNKETTDTGRDVFTFYGKEGFNERLRTNVSGSLTVYGVSGWTSGSELKIGGNNLTASIDEFRLWTTPLSESRVDNHTLLPDAIDGNHHSSSTEDLIFRLDFEYPKDRGTDNNIKNVAINTQYNESFATASNYSSISTYPYHYTPYDRTVTATVPSSGLSVGNKVRFETQTKISDLSYRSRATKKSFDESPLDSDKLGLFFSPIKEINMDILKSLGSFSIDNYIGNPSDEYSDEYVELKKLRNYYFDRFTLNMHEYIQLVRYIDKSLFDVLESLVPARAKVSTGLLIEPHILERSKTKWTKPSGEKRDYKSTIPVKVETSFTNEGIESILDVDSNTNLSGENIQFETTILTEESTNLSGDKNDYLTVINTTDDTNVSGVITRNSESTMGGFEIQIDVKDLGKSITTQFENSTEGYENIGSNPDSVTVSGFGIYADNGNAIRTILDKNNNFVQERVKVFLLKQSYTEKVPTNIDTNDNSRGTQLETITKHRRVVSILPFTGSDGTESSTPSGGDIVSATPVNGYLSSHYRNVGDLTTGLENSFFNGSKQTSATTTDGGSPVQIFTTNPNTLKVSDSGRGSGEPILEVE